LGSIAPIEPPTWRRVTLRTITCLVRKDLPDSSTIVLPGKLF
jgi:hypothetical protein